MNLCVCGTDLSWKLLYVSQIACPTLYAMYFQVLSWTEYLREHPLSPLQKNEFYFPYGIC